MRKLKKQFKQQVKQKLKQLSKPQWQVSVAAACMMFLSGCELGYYSQAALGHLQLTRSQVPLEDAEHDPRLQATERERLGRVPEFLDFASKALALPAKGQYRKVAFIERTAVTWNVFAAPPLSLEPKVWCFPAAGCLSYRGYFKQQAAERFAQSLLKDNLQTYISPASAYSTLGWFDDPLLSSFLTLHESDLMGLLFHELAHQKLYVKGDTTFNESFATAVAQAGVAHWYQTHPTELGLAQYQQRRELRESFLTFALDTKDQLAALYENPTELSTEHLLAQRDKLIEAFREAYEKKVASQWQGKRPFGQWMQGPLNNAQWNTLGSYYTLVPAFTQLLAEHQGRFESFYKACEYLAIMPINERHEQLRLTSINANKSQKPLNLN